VPSRVKLRVNLLITFQLKTEIRNPLTANQSEAKIPTEVGRTQTCLPVEWVSSAAREAAKVAK
jgi:hypothetical protein